MSRKIIDYTIFESYTADHLCSLIHAVMKEGRTPFGGVSVCQHPQQQNLLIYSQCVVMYEDSEEAQWQSERIEVIKGLNKEKEMLTAMIPEATKQNGIGAVMTLRERLNAIDKYIGRLLEPVFIDGSATGSATPNILETLGDVKP